MDKVTLGQYGWIIVVSLAISTLFALATPFGTGVADSLIALIRGTTVFQNEAYSDDSIKEQTDYMEDLFDYSSALQPGLYGHRDAANLVFDWEDYVEEGYIRITLANNKDIKTVATAKTPKTNGDLIIGDEIEEIGDATFQNATSLRLVRLGVATKRVENFAFASCINLETFHSNKHLTKIGVAAFQNNYNLKTVCLKDELKQIETRAFTGCYKLQEINYSGTVAQWNAISKENGWKDSTLKKVICKDGEVTFES